MSKINVKVSNSSLKGFIKVVGKEAHLYLYNFHVDDGTPQLVAVEGLYGAKTPQEIAECFIIDFYLKLV